MAIEWGAVRQRLEDNERALLWANHPDEAAVRAVHRQRMIALSERRGCENLASRHNWILVCALGAEQYGFLIAGLLQVARLPAYTPMGSYRSCRLGVFAWHGDIRSVVCARSLFHLDEEVPTRVGDPIVFPKSLGGRSALRVDAFGEIISMDRENTPFLPEIDSSWSRYVRGRTHGGVNVVDLDAVTRHPIFSECDGAKFLDGLEITTPI